MDIDYATALLLEEEFSREFGSSSEGSNTGSIINNEMQFELPLGVQQKTSRAISSSSDFMLAKNLQEQFNKENAVENPSGSLVYDKKNRKIDNSKSIVDPSWEVIDPTPDVHRLFIVFNEKFFWGTLDSVCVSWSKKMKRCAGVCRYSPNAGFCHITLSEPLLKLRPRKDLVETLLHEMIHAYLFVAHNDREREGHGPEFHKHMNRINNEVGTNITVYHDFHDEVELYLQHKWRCNGPCQNWTPYFGFIKRSVNRAPGPNDRWWGEHSRNCGGSFIKIESPEPKTKFVSGSNAKKEKQNKPVGDILKYFPTKPTILSEKLPMGNQSNIHTISNTSSGMGISIPIPSKTNKIRGFSSGTTGTESFSGQKGSLLNTKKDVNNKKTTTASKSIKSTGSTVGVYTDFDTRNEKTSGETCSEYDVVRNHWINKFPNTGTGKDIKTNIISSIPNKRKSDNQPCLSKIPKVDNTIQSSSLNERVLCPVCNIAYLIDDLNNHLDKCLSNPQNIQKECIVCLKNYKESEYEKHFEECIKNSFDVKEESKEKINCTICNNDIIMDNWNNHVRICKNRNKCPECKENIKPNDYDVHLANCLIKKLDNINELYNDRKEEEIKLDLIKAEERTDCLACGKNILKLELNVHLDECLNELFQDDMTHSDVNKEDGDKMYNCPICLKLVLLMEMNEHINICLKIVDEDKEIETNKKNFLSEMI